MKTKFIVEIKKSRNPIPYEYGFSTKKLAEEFKKHADSNPSSLFCWSNLKEKEKPEWGQFYFIK